MSAAVALSAEALGVRFGDREVVSDVRLEVARGEILGVVGESGSGKTMTLLALAGLLPPGGRMRGQVRMDGVDVSGLPDRAARRLRGRAFGLVFQEPLTALNPVMRIGDQVAETLRLHGRTRSEASAGAILALSRAGLPDPESLLDRYPHQLSGGQRQRAAIAIATALSPPLLLADEPTTALDVTTQAEVMDVLVRRVREDGAAMILVSHDLPLVARVADRIAVMRQGRIETCAPASEIIAGRTPGYARELVAASAFRPPRPARVTTGDPVLDVRGLVCRHGPGRPAVDGVSLTVRRGERVGLVGESGAGKTTLLRAILGLERPQAGEVRLDGERFPAGAPERRAAQRRRVQAVFQDPGDSLDPRWRVRRIVGEPIAFGPMGVKGPELRSRVDAALAQVGLEPDAADRPPYAFSGGQRQRIALARALVGEPDLLVLDEPTSALDASVRAQILDLIDALAAARGLALLFVTHDFGLVARSTDRVLVMREGRFVEEGPTDALFAAPKEPYTARLLAATPKLEAPA